jgi:hypothetical protein
VKALVGSCWRIMFVSRGVCWRNAKALLSVCVCAKGVVGGFCV